MSEERKYTETQITRALLNTITTHYEAEATPEELDCDLEFMINFKKKLLEECNG